MFTCEKSNKTHTKIQCYIFAKDMHILNDHTESGLAGQE